MDRSNVGGAELTRFFDDINQMCGVVKLLTATLVKDSLTLLGLAIVLFMIAPLLAFGVLCIYGLTAVPTFGLGRLMKNQARKSRSITEHLVKETMEFLRFRTAIRALSAERFFASKMNSRITEESAGQKRLSQIDRAAPSIIEISAVFGFAILLLIFGTAIFQQLSVSGVFAFSLATIALYGPLKNVGTFHIGWQRAMASAERVEPILAQAQRQDFAGRFQRLLRISIDRCAIDGTCILSGIDLRFSKGETVAVVGPNGAGKTTFLSCVAGLQRFDGTIQVDSQTYKGSRICEPVAWRAFAGAAPAIFNISVRDNICLGGITPGDPDLWELLDHVGLRKEFSRMDIDLDSLPGETGCILSHGMQQRLVLARLLLKRPEFVILDEVFAAIEPGDTVRLLRIVRDRLRDCCVILATHDFDLIRSADRVLVMGDGAITRDLPVQEFLEESPYGISNSFDQTETDSGLPYRPATNAAHRKLGSMEQ
jgi:ABC-type bacteriocin/lantibiotic exporter with double-glycine peptidase domain